MLVGYFALGILMNAISRSLPERLVMTPVVFVLAVCCLIIALGYGRAAVARCAGVWWTALVRSGTC